MITDHKITDHKISDDRTKINFGSTDSVAGRFGYLWTDTADGVPVVLASGWTEDPDYLAALVHPSIRPARIGAAGNRDIDRAVHDYSDGDPTAIDAVTVRQRSGPFIEAAWEALRKTPPGEPVSYTDLALHAGRPDAVRAAAAACAYNAAALFVPCHRIVRRDGSLGGFRYGLDVKRTLRAHETQPAEGSLPPQNSRRVAAGAQTPLPTRREN